MNWGSMPDGVGLGVAVGEADDDRVGGSLGDGESPGEAGVAGDVDGGGVDLVAVVAVHPLAVIAMAAISNVGARRPP